MPSQKKQTKAKATTTSPFSVKAPSKSKTKGKDNKTSVPTYISLISNNGDFGDYFWTDASGASQDTASLAANQGSENGHSAGPSGQ